MTYRSYYINVLEIIVQKSYFRTIVTIALFVVLGIEPRVLNMLSIIPPLSYNPRLSASHFISLPLTLTGFYSVALPSLELTM